MAISKKSLERIAALIKTDITTIENAIKSDKDVDLTIDETLTVLTTEELTTRDNNMKGQGKAESEGAGEIKGKDLAIKAIAKQIGIANPNKELNQFVLDVQNKIAGEDALKDQIKLLQKEVKEKDTKVTELETTINLSKSDNELIAMLPEKRSKSLVDGEHLDIVKRNLEFTNDGVKYKGQILRKGNTQDPLSKKEAIDYFYTQRAGLIDGESGGGAGGSGGRGGGNSGEGGSGGKQSLKDVRKAWEVANPGQTWGNQSSQSHLAEVTKQNPDLVMEDDGL